MPWASLAHFIPLASSTHFIFSYLCHPYEFLLNPLGFPGLIITSLLFGLIGLCPNPMNLLIPLLGFLDPFSFFLATYYFCGPIDHCSYRFSLMVFISLFSFSFFLFFILLGFFCHWDHFIIIFGFSIKQIGLICKVD